MKEGPGRYINPFLSNEDNDKVNFTTNLSDEKFEKPLEPSSVPSESLEKAKEVYIDKNVTECQLPETTCYEENVVKDICVDEGLSHGEMIKCDKEHLELSCNPITVNEDKHGDMIKDDHDTQLISSPVEDCCMNTCSFTATEEDNVASNCASDKIKLFVESNIGCDNLMQNDDEEVISSPNLQNSIVREEKSDQSPNLLDNSIKVLEPAVNGVNGVNDVDQQLSESTGSEANERRQTNHTINVPNEIKIAEITTSNSDNMKPATTNSPHELLLNTESALSLHDMASNNILLTARGGGESSFSMAGPVSGHITYLGPITSAGSLSHRSDGSNSSVRSFAFPILQNEWNSSPVRMAKADPKHSRKYRGWRQTLMCCRF